MTEAEWLACEDPCGLLRWKQIPLTERKVRLFAVACCKRIPVVNSYTILAAVIDTVERFADRLATEDELREANLRADGTAASAGETADADESTEGITETTVGWQAIHCAAWAAYWASLSGDGLWTGVDRLPGPAADAVGLALAGNDYDQVARDAEKERAAQADLLRDIFNNPFRPIPTLAPAWLTWHDGLVVRLAQTAYDERHLPSGTLDTGRLAVLADALEESGCTDADILGHLRGPGPHVRGCWVVDLLLGKE